MNYEAHPRNFAHTIPFKGRQWHLITAAILVDERPDLDWAHALLQPGRVIVPSRKDSPTNHPAEFPVSLLVSNEQDVIEACADCGADYNMSGQRLASREQWGEETGEHMSDILLIR